YPALYWQVAAINDLGSNGSGIFRLGIDSTAPTSHVSPLSQTSAQTSFLVRWVSADDLSGVKCTQVQVRDGQDGGWADWYGCTTASFALFQGQDGHTYYFRSRATDVAGNQGTFAGGDGDTSISVNVAAATVWWNGGYQYNPPI